MTPASAASGTDSKARHPAHLAAAGSASLDRSDSVLMPCPTRGQFHQQIIAAFGTQSFTNEKTKRRSYLVVYSALRLVKLAVSKIVSYFFSVSDYFITCVGETLSQFWGQQIIAAGGIFLVKLASAHDRTKNLQELRRPPKILTDMTADLSLKELTHLQNAGKFVHLTIRHVREKTCALPAGDGRPPRRPCNAPVFPAPIPATICRCQEAPPVRNTITIRDAD